MYLQLNNIEINFELEVNSTSRPFSFFGVETKNQRVDMLNQRTSNHQKHLRRGMKDHWQQRNQPKN